MTRILGIDLGERRIGVAISTPEGGLAVPLRIIDAQDETSDIARIVDLARDEDAGAIVVGHPISLSGSRGPQAQRVEAFAERLAGASGMPVELWDERLTSKQAERTAPGARSAPRAPADDIAAAIMLQSYLDRRRATHREA